MIQGVASVSFGSAGSTLRALLKIQNILKKRLAFEKTL
jgi:hypothetical protein